MRAVARIVAVALCALFQQPVVTEYPLPRSGAFPHDPAVANDGTVWFTDQHNSFIGRLDPQTGRVVDYPTPTRNAGPHGIVVAPDGVVWFTENAKGKIGRLDPATGSIREYMLPAAARDPHTPLILDGKIWFTAQGANLYGWLDSASGETRVFPLGIPHARPYGLVAGPDRSIWIALFGTNRIGRIKPADGSLHLFALPAQDARPRRLIVDGGSIVWFTDYERGALGRLDPASGDVQEFPSPGGPNSAPYGIALGTDGRVWYDESSTGQMIAFDPVSHRMSVTTIPTPGAIVRNISVDSTRGRVWLALSGTSRLGNIQLLEFAP